MRKIEFVNPSFDTEQKLDFEFFYDQEHNLGVHMLLSDLYITFDTKELIRHGMTFNRMKEDVSTVLWWGQRVVNGDIMLDWMRNDEADFTQINESEAIDLWMEVGGKIS